MFDDALDRLPAGNDEAHVTGLRNALGYVEAGVELGVSTSPTAALDRYFHALALTHHWPRYCSARGWPMVWHQPTVEIAYRAAEVVRERAAEQLGKSFAESLWPVPLGDRSDAASMEVQSGAGTTDCVPRMETDCVPRMETDCVPRMETDCVPLIDAGLSGGDWVVDEDVFSTADLAEELALLARIRRELGAPASAPLHLASAYLRVEMQADPELVSC